ncbi:MAG: hypothetical protein C3F13_16440 [Anaerolineales bacterium]|nr:MAG: hypothetical protein C3F13_16440 [Anaerolineales bacterium]
MDDHTLRLSWSWLLLPLALFLILLGALSSPRDAQGRPLLLLPEVKAVEEYRRSMNSATDGMQLLDGEIATLLAGQNTDLFTQSRQAQAAFEHALRITQEVDVQTAPPALEGLREVAAGTASAYLEAARLALRWVSLPQESYRTNAENSLAQARLQLNTFRESKWLAMR